MHLKFAIRQLGQLICVREPKWNPLKAGREAALVAALQRNWVAEPGQKLSVQNLRGQQNAKTPKDPIINSIFSVAAKTKCQELTLSSRMTGGTARRTTSRVPRTPRTSRSRLHWQRWRQVREDIKWNATEAPAPSPATASDSDSMRVTETTGLSAVQPPWMAITPSRSILRLTWNPVQDGMVWDSQFGGL